MPPLLHDEDASDDDIPTNGVPKHTESGVEADVEAKDQLKDDLMSDIEETKGSKVAKEEKERVSPTASNADDDDDDDEENAYEVEAIRAHEWRRKKGKPFVLLYNVKWKGFPDSENTLEPEGNLLGSRDILAKYHHSIGGAPQPPSAQDLKKKPSRKSLREESTAASATEDSVPPAKRQKRAKRDDSALSDDFEEETNFGSYQPIKASWENEIKEIQTVERDQASDDLYILMIFKNGKKSRVKNSLVRQKAPQKLLNFYEAHLSV